MNQGGGKVSLPETRSDEVRYLIMDSRQDPPLPRALYERADNPIWVYLYTDTRWQPYLEESPIVVETTRQSPEYKWALTGLQDGQLTGLVLTSSDGLEAVANWFRARLMVRFDGQRQGLLRLYDPRVWHRLSPASGPEADVIERVIYWDGDPESECWQTTENPAPFAMSPVPTLNERQWLALKAITGQT